MERAAPGNGAAPSRQTLRESAVFRLLVFGLLGRAERCVASAAGLADRGEGGAERRFLIGLRELQQLAGGGVEPRGRGLEGLPVLPDRGQCTRLDSGPGAAAFREQRGDLRRGLLQD